MGKPSLDPDRTRLYVAAERAPFARLRENPEAVRASDIWMGAGRLTYTDTRVAELLHPGEKDPLLALFGWQYIVLDRLWSRDADVRQEEDRRNILELPETHVRISIGKLALSAERLTILRILDEAGEEAIRAFLTHLALRSGPWRGGQPEAWRFLRRLGLLDGRA